MRIAVFFMCMCFLLLQKGGTAMAGTKQAQTAYSQKHTARTIKHIQAIFEDTDTDYEADCFINDTDDTIEDEESNDFTTGKAKLVLPVQSSPPYPRTLIYLYKSAKAPPAVYGLASCRYITQRVLRL